MLKEFTVDFRRNEVWKFTIALYLSAAGSGAALVLFSLLTGMKVGTFVGLGMGILGEAALFLDLGHRMRFWRAITKGTQTWISLGTLANTSLLASGVLFILLPEGSLLSVVFKIIALISALTVVVYGSTLLSYMASIPFWRSSLLPVVFLGHSTTSAVAIMLAILELTGQSIGLYGTDFPLAIALLLFTFLFTWLYTRKSTSPSEAVQESLRLLTKGRLRPFLVGGAYLVGLLVPLLLIIGYFLFPRSFGVMTTVFVVTAMVFRFVGDINFRYSVLEAGIYEPII